VNKDKEKARHSFHRFCYGWSWYDALLFRRIVKTGFQVASPFPKLWMWTLHPITLLLHLG
jgi:hypothetical protein